MIINPGEINLDEALNICKEAFKKGERIKLNAINCNCC